MMKFKPNFFVGFMFLILEMMYPLMAGMIIMLAITMMPLQELLEGLWALVVYVPLGTVVFCGTLMLISWPFTKYKVFLEDKCFYYEGGTRVWYCDVTEIVFDSGFAGKGGSNEHCCLDCYGGNKMLFSVNHPSLVMTVLLIKRCKNAKVRYRRIKQMIGMWAFCVVVCVAAGLYGRFGG
jgi:hypothetical protein